MAFYPSHSYTNNLERTGRDTVSGPWKISPLVDLVSEKRFLLFTLKSKALAGWLPNIMTFRGQAGPEIAPDGCTRVLATTVRGDRLEILTEYVEVLRETDVKDELLPGLFQSVTSVLRRFEKCGLQASDLYPEALGRADDGSTFLLPNAYIVPEFTRRPSGAHASRTGPGRWNRTLDAFSETDISAHHAILLARLIHQLTGPKPEGRQIRIETFTDRLRRTADAIFAGELRTLPAATAEIFGRDADSPAPSAEVTAVDDAIIHHIADAALTDGSVILVRGARAADRADLISRATATLGRSDACDVIYLDEWDLFGSQKRRSFAKGRQSHHPVWIIDDVQEKALPYAEFARTLLNEQSGSVILCTNGTEPGAETQAFIEELRAAREDNFHDVDVPSKKTRTDRKSEKSKRTKEETQLLELVTVARFSLPLDIVLSIFPDSEQSICAAIQRLVSGGVIELLYRAVPGKAARTVFIKTKTPSVRRTTYAGIGAARRKKLHRTVMMLAEQYTGFPTYFLLYHAMASGEPGHAARHIAAYLKETQGGPRNTNILSIAETRMKKGQLEDLPLNKRVFVSYELGREMQHAGRESDAENLLLAAKTLIDESDHDQKLKSASVLTDILRLLAEQKEARGEFKQALAFLNSAKEQFQTAVPIPDQARLLNDIGWMQYRLGDYEKSMESCRLSLNTLDANRYPSIVAQALNLMGVVHFNTSRYDEAISYYEQAAFLRERAGDDNALAASFNNLALAYQSKGEYQKALDYYNKSFELKRKQDNKEGIAGGYLNLALLHLEAGNYAEAEQRCLESLKISGELGNAQLEADNYITLGDIALGGGDLEAAEGHYQKSRGISHQLEAINEEMGALRRLSTIYLRQKRYDEAWDHALKASELVQRIGSKYETAQIDVILGELETQRGNLTEALEHYELASTNYTSLSKYRLAATVLSRIGLIQAKTGNTFDAKQSLDRANDLVRADIGHELPEEFVTLQQTLRTQPSRTPGESNESQKLLMSFYDLSALSDHAADRHEFFRKMMDTVREIVDPNECYLALRTEGSNFLVIDNAGERIPSGPKGITAAFERTLHLGGILESRSKDAADVAGDVALPKGHEFVCVPIKVLGEDIGCLMFYLPADRVPLSKEDINFFTWIGRQLGGSVKLMLYMNDDLLKDSLFQSTESGQGSNEAPRHRFEKLIGKSESMKAIFRLLDRVKNHDSGILIMGESGTGKSALARAAHYKSPRAPHPFQEIHCAQIPHNLLESELFGHERGSFTGAVQRKLGLCEAANGGTVFLDDINVLPIETQSKLLHFLENKSFMRLGGTQRLTSDVRIIAAANQDLEKLCRDGRFREDLFYRLKVILIDLPPLRERQEDMLAIALDYLKRSCAEKSIALKTLSRETIQLFQKAPWRGNVRELQNVLERIVVLSDENIISPASLPEDFLKEVAGTSEQSHQRLEELAGEIVKLGSYSSEHPLLPALEAILADKMVRHVRGKNRAAGLLGISKPTLYARLRDFDRMR